MLLLSELADLSNRVAATASRLAKTEAMAGFLLQLGAEELEVGVDFLAGRLRQGRIGLGWAALSEARAQPEGPGRVLSLLDVDRAFQAIAEEGGAGSAGRRREVLGRLFAAASAAERDLLARLVMGELRQGAVEGVLLEAVARAARVAPTALRRAVMLAGEVAPVAKAVLRGGAAGLEGFRLQLLRPVQPMLAQPAASLQEALSSMTDGLALEWKLDGARVQVHKAGDQVAIFTRALNQVTAAPELEQLVRALPARELILDGEAIAMTAEGRPQPFQVTMRRFGRDSDHADLRRELPLFAFFFDLLYLDGEELLDRPAGERDQALALALPAALRVPRLVSPDDDAAAAFLDQAIERGHEGVMAKSLSAPYEAGRRGSAWLKVKRAHTLDLVVLAVEWGSGRRRGWLSNLHLGARDPAGGGFVMLGKTFKGMTDEMLAWQTERLQALAVERSGHLVQVRPELVVEVAFDGVQESPHYPGGLALRFARVKRYRPDRDPASASTIDEVRAIEARARGG